MCIVLPCSSTGGTSDFLSGERLLVEFPCLRGATDAEVGNDTAEDLRTLLGFRRGCCWFNICHVASPVLRVASRRVRGVAVYFRDHLGELVGALTPAFVKGPSFRVRRGRPP